MNYLLTELPDSGKNPIVIMEISVRSIPIGNIKIKLYRDVFPAGVENFVKIIEGNTRNISSKGFGNYKYQKEIKRSYIDCNFFHVSYKNYIISGDIYNNNGTSAGTIYNDSPIPADFGPYFFPHDKKGMISLVPFKDDETGQLFYDSTFMIILDDANSFNNISDLDSDQIVIGQIIDGIEVLDTINNIVRPFAKKIYPQLSITNAYVYRVPIGNRRIRPFINK